MENQNRNNRVHTEEQPGKADFQIAGLLPFGKDNAVTTQELMRLTGCRTARELQQRIAYEREHGAIICSGSGRGYCRPKDRQEIQLYLKCKKSRALNTLKVIRSARQVLKVPEGQQSIEGSENDGQ